MAARPIASTTISFGLVSIPIKLFTATSSESVSFNQLHKTCGSRVKQRLWCPVCEATVERDDLVKGFEVAKNQYVQFTGEELRGLEAERFQTLDLVEFVPEDTVDFIYIDGSYYLGPDKGGDKAFNLLTKAMRRMKRIAVGRLWWRGKVQLTLLRPYKKGLILHQVYYANEVRSYDEVELGEDKSFSQGEEDLAAKLVEQLASERFQPDKYRDEYSGRVQKAAEEKVAGQQVTLAPEQPAAQIVDLFEALKRSLGEASVAQATGTEGAAPRPGAAKQAKAGTAKLRGPRKAS